MKISGFTFIKNGIEYGYPFVESIKSLLPLCDEVIVAVGDCTDTTRQSILDIKSNKIVIIDTIWDNSLRAGGVVLAQQTNIALSYCTSDWCIYLQGDEVLHEDDYETIRNGIVQANENSTIEAFIFNWRHFFGSYEYIGVGRQWYKREIRAFRNTGRVFSWGDAQGFRTKDENGNIRKLRSKQTEGRIFHYGWVRHPKTQLIKHNAFARLYHDDGWFSKEIPSSDEFDYMCYETTLFNETHPLLMHQRILRDTEWTSKYDQTRRKKRPFLVWLTDTIEHITGYRIGEYKNFIEV